MEHRTEIVRAFVYVMESSHAAETRFPCEAFMHSDTANVYNKTPSTGVDLDDVRARGSHFNADDAYIGAAVGAHKFMD